MSCGLGTRRYRRYVGRLHGGFARAGIPERLKRLHGHSVTTRTISSEPGKVEAYASARQFVLGLASVPNDARHAGQGLLVLGPNGVGKSGLMVLIAQAIYQMGIGFLWMRWGSLLEDIRDQYGKNESGARQLVAQRVPILLLDDLGDPFRRRGDYQESENKRSILMDVLGYRHEMLKPTVVTANYASRGEMEEQLDPRITSRLFEMCHVVHMGGRDLRS